MMFIEIVLQPTFQFFDDSPEHWWRLASSTQVSICHTRLYTRYLNSSRLSVSCLVICQWTFLTTTQMFNFTGNLITINFFLFKIAYNCQLLSNHYEITYLLTNIEALFLFHPLIFIFNVLNISISYSKIRWQQLSINWQLLPDFGSLCYEYVEYRNKDQESNWKATRHLTEFIFGQSSLKSRI